jgi:hypothetical protein
MTAGEIFDLGMIFDCEEEMTEEQLDRLIDELGLEDAEGDSSAVLEPGL